MYITLNTLCYAIWNLEEYQLLLTVSRSSPSEVFLGKGVLKICSKFTGEHPC